MNNSGKDFHTRDEYEIKSHSKSENLEFVILEWDVDALVILRLNNTRNFHVKVKLQIDTCLQS